MNPLTGAAASRFRVSEIRRGIPFTPPPDPLHRYTLGKMGAKLRSHPLQSRYKAFTRPVTDSLILE
jgi:hypothetical protein